MLDSISWRILSTLIGLSVWATGAAHISYISSEFQLKLEQAFLTAWPVGFLFLSGISLLVATLLYDKNRSSSLRFSHLGAIIGLFYFVIVGCAVMFWMSLTIFTEPFVWYFGITPFCLLILVLFKVRRLTNQDGQEGK